MRTVQKTDVTRGERALKNGILEECLIKDAINAPVIYIGQQDITPLDPVPCSRDKCPAFHPDQVCPRAKITVIENETAQQFRTVDKSIAAIKIQQAVDFLHGAWRRIKENEK